MKNGTYKPRKPPILTAEQDRLQKASDEAYKRFQNTVDPAVRILLFAAYERASNAFMESLKNG